MDTKAIGSKGVSAEEIVKRITLYYYNKSNCPDSGRIPRDAFEKSDMIYKQEVDLLFSMARFLYFWDVIDLLTVSEVNNAYFIEEDKYDRYCKMVQLMLDCINGNEITE